MAMEERKPVPNERKGFERLSRARNQEILHMEAELKTLQAKNAQLMNRKETAKDRINKLQGDIDDKKAEIAKRKSKNDDMLRTSRENKLRIVAFERKLIINGTKFQSNTSKFQLQAGNCPQLADNFNFKDEMEEKIYLLTKKRNLEIQNKMLKLNIKGALAIKYKEKYSDQLQ